MGFRVVNVLNYGWYFKSSPTMPDVSSYTLADLGDSDWTQATLDSWKARMNAVTGQPNPYYDGSGVPSSDPDPEPESGIPQGPHVLPAGSSMPRGGTGLVSLNGSFTFRYIGRGNLTLRTDAQLTVLWDSPESPDGTTPLEARLSLDGNLELVTDSLDVY